MRNKHRSLTFVCFTYLASAALLVAAGCSHHESTPPGPAPSPSSQALNPNPTQVDVYQVAAKDQMNQADPNGLLKKPIPLAPDSRTPAKDAINKMAADPNGPLPKGTRLLSLNIDKTGLATADFSPEFEKNFPGGDTQEAQVINSVLQTLGQFPNVRNVQFLVDGKKVASLGGTQDLDDPLPVIRPDQSATKDDAKQNVAMSDGQGQ